MNIYVIVSLALTIYFLLAWFLGSWLGLEGSDLWILRGALALIGIAAAVAYIWYQLRSVKQEAASAKGDRSGAKGRGGEVDVLIREAQRRLASSELGRKAKLANLPVFLLFGKEGSTKTSTVVHCGLHPDLLSGQVYGDDAVIPTSTANLWYARRAVFVEAGGRLLAQGPQWNRLLKRLRPRALSALFRARREAPRAALVCVSCEEFLKPDAGDALSATARNLRARLGEVSQAFGVRLPVYVLFTKTDRIAFFGEYVRNLSNEETGQVLGVTLPAEADESTGVYAERQSRRLTPAFNDLFYSLCDRRTDFLSREHDAEKLPGVYEFPRELRKLRPNLVQLLVDLCRPSQLRAGPFLRGFYFSGVRAVMTQETPAQAPRAERATRDVSGATMVFTADQAMGAQQAATPQSVVRKKPQWLFLSHLFSDVLLGDTAVMGGGTSSVRTSRLRRILLAAGAALCLIWIVGMIVSYAGNRGLQSEVIEAARGIGTGEAAGGEVASLDALNRLETLRQALDRLTHYELEGPPWRLRWGLYSGHRLYPQTRRAYYSRFHQLLFGTAQASLIGTLQRLPAKPGPADEYSPIYDSLKAYLITTSHPDKSTQAFLSPVLMKHWARGREIDAQRMELAQKQFDFYAEDLRNSNPFSSEHDTLAVERGRQYLSQFAGIERVYQFMLAEASKANPSVNFNRMFPGSEQVVVNQREVPGAFTKGGWDFMQKAMKNADRFFGGERWVLGEQAAAGVDRAELERQVTERYRKDFVDEWRAYLNETEVVRYRNLGDAASKLNTLSGNQSPLLAALWLASRNTAVESDEIKQTFQPVQFVVPPESETRLIGDSNSSYMNSLVGLQASVEQAANASPGERDPVVGQVNAQATQAKVVTRQVAQNFRIDPNTKVESTVQELMEKPILYAEALVRALGPAELNAKGRALCGQLQALMRKYPFKADAGIEASLAEVAAIFQPGSGALWTFYEEDLREHLMRQGPVYAANPASKMRLNPAFVNFFNRAAAFSEAIYPGGSREARLNYKLTGYPAEGIRRLNLTVENQALVVERSPAGQAFLWPGSGNQTVTLTGQFGGGPDLAFASYEGLWAIFRFFGDADRWQTAGNVHRLEWVLRQGRAGRPLTLPDGRPLTVRFDLEAAAPVFHKGFLAGLDCVSTVAR